jgi:hypothetical protein
MQTMHNAAECATLPFKSFEQVMASTTFDFCLVSSLRSTVALARQNHGIWAAHQQGYQHTALQGKKALYLFILARC